MLYGNYLGGGGILSDHKPALYGGQAVIEGVMFGGKHVNVTAIRRKDHSIDYFEAIKRPNPTIAWMKKIPILRGIVGLIEASAIGSKHLNFATERYDLDPADDDKIEEEQPSKWVMIFGVAAIGVLSFIVGKLIFTLVPAVLASVLFDRIVPNEILNNLLEGIIKTVLLLCYLFFISRAPFVKRLFQYHGAEHKVINAYENGVELTVANVQKFSRLHYRCGSSFIILSVIVGVIVYSFFQYDGSILTRIYLRLLLLPLVIGISYEVLRLTNAVREVPFLSYLGYPGLWLQKLTTREPDDQQVEVALAAFEKMKLLDEETETKRATSSSSSLAHIG